MARRYTDLIGSEDIIVLGIESSCDETAAAVTRGRAVLSDVIYSQTMHERYGGVVPEIASREHTLAIIDVIDDALANAHLTLNDIDVIAVTASPGLIGALLVGVTTAKAIAMAKNIPLIAIDHIQAHICANYAGSDLQPPFIGLVASGGHTSIIDIPDYNTFVPLVTTSDDAIGEAFDKVARILGLPYPGGVHVDKMAQKGSPSIKFIKPIVGSVSYSGLKTAVLNYVNRAKMIGEQLNIPDICASFTAQAIEMPIKMCIRAAKENGRDTVVLSGGVAANSFLRAELTKKAAEQGIKVVMPPLRYCTDNAVMVALRGYLHAYCGLPLSDLSLNAKSG